MRALIWHVPRSMTLEELPEPIPGKGELLPGEEAAGSTSSPGTRVAVDPLLSCGACHPCAGGCRPGGPGRNGGAVGPRRTGG